MTFSLARSLSVSLAFAGRGRMVLISGVEVCSGCRPSCCCRDYPAGSETQHKSSQPTAPPQKKGGPARSLLSVFEQHAFSKHSSATQALYRPRSNGSMSSHRKALSPLGPALRPPPPAGSPGSPHPRPRLDFLVKGSDRKADRKTPRPQQRPV